jgi:hypothetical protein
MSSSGYSGPESSEGQPPKKTLFDENEGPPTPPMETPGKAGTPSSHSTPGKAPGGDDTSAENIFKKLQDMIQTSNDTDDMLKLIPDVYKSKGNAGNAGKDLIYTDTNSKSRSLISDTPTIEDINAEFNKIKDPVIKQFYLALSRNIQKNYELSSNTTKDKDTLLLRLRKNSLLLQLPSFFDYVKMQLGVEVEPVLSSEDNKKFMELQQECAKLKSTDIHVKYNTDEAYNLAKQLIPLEEKNDIRKLEEQNGLLHEIYPTTIHKYESVEIKQLSVVEIDGKKQFKRIQIQESMNCGRAALLNFFGTEDLLVKGSPLETEKMFDLKSPRPSTKIDMGAICNLYSKCMKLFSDI